jgi:hypothetical protein
VHTKNRKRGIKKYEEGSERLEQLRKERALVSEKVYETLKKKYKSETEISRENAIIIRISARFLLHLKIITKKYRDKTCFP